MDAADVHVARELARLGGERDETVLLAVALAVRGPRLGHVHVDLAADPRHRGGRLRGADRSRRRWTGPSRRAWIARVGASALVSDGDRPATGDVRPLRLVGSWLYLDRYWAEEVRRGPLAACDGREPAPAR